jgi:predicted RNase H-like HicB family nuclease
MMERFKYEIDIFWSEEDEGYIADVPDLKYCSAWGETYEEALREARVAMELHLEVLEKTGRPIPEPRARQAS